MRPIPHLLVFALVILPAHAADALPSGEFVLVNSVLPGPRQRATTPVYTHLTLTDGHMEFRFISTAAPDALSCKETQKCERAVNALGLDYVLENDRIVVTDHEIRTGPRMLIDHQESDLPLIIEPMLQLVDGATATVGENEVSFHAPDGTDARFLAGSLAEAQEAMAFAMSWGVSLHDLDRCVLRQIAEVRLREETGMSEAEHNLLKAVDAAGISSEVQQAGQYWAMMPDAPEANSPEIQRLTTAAAYLRILPQAVRQYPEVTPEQAQAMMLERLSEAESFDATIVDEYVTPNREGLLQLGRYHIWFGELLSEGEDPVKRLCQSVLLD